jgi:hypothetical protein
MLNDVPKGTEIATALLLGMGIWCSIYLFISICTSFRRWWTLYFLSMILATLGQTFIIISVMIYIWAPSSFLKMSTAFEVPGTILFGSFSLFILYSRLGLLTQNRSVLRVVLGLLLTEIVVFELPMGVLYAIATHIPSPKRSNIYKSWSDAEDIAYFSMDIILTALYIWQVKVHWISQDQQHVKVFRNLLIMATINALVDITYLVLSYTISDTLFLGFYVRTQGYTLVLIH